ncbi:DNA modification methylase [Patescibacteria group bacterium]|nr:DNA modification methylase [Patescibacteria group bacterium]
MNFIIDENFKNYITALTQDEFDVLKENILKDGCRDSLVVWEESNILLDGHNRLEICKENNIEFEVKYLSFESRLDAEIWVIKNQFGRRNLTKYQRGELALKLKPMVAEKAKQRQIEAGESFGENHPKTEEGCQKSDKALGSIDTKKEIAKTANVSHDTIHKVEKISTKGIDELKNKARSGEISINTAATIATEPKEKQKVIVELTEKEILAKAGDIRHKRKQERRQKQVNKEKEALKSIDIAEQLWRITEDQKVIDCQSLITDPPYGILNEPWEPEKLKEFTLGWATRWNRCNADFVLIFWSQRYLWDGRKWFDQTLKNYSFQQLLVWNYANNKSPQSRQMFKQTWEPVFFYRRNNSKKEIRVYGSDWGEDLTDFDCYSAAVPQSNFNNHNRKEHPAQKPLSVMRWLVNATTNIGDLVCDPFMGSGTTGIACSQLKRKFVGIELDSNYREVAEQRIAAYG